MQSEYSVYTYSVYAYRKLHDNPNGELIKLAGPFPSEKEAIDVAYDLAQKRGDAARKRLTDRIIDKNRWLSHYERTGDYVLYDESVKEIKRAKQMRDEILLTPSELSTRYVGQPGAIYAVSSGDPDDHDYLLVFRD